MKHIQKSKTYRETLSDPKERKKTFSQLPYQTRHKTFQELGLDIADVKDRDNLSRSWSKHRKNLAMIKEAKEMVAVDKAKVEEAAAASAAPPAPVPQASHNSAGLEEAAKAALAAATNANQVAANANQIGYNANQVATSANQAVENLAGTVGEQGKQIVEQGKQIGEQGKQIGEQGKQIADLKDIAFGYGNRLTNVETRQDAADVRMDVAETRMDAADGRMDEMQETINALTEGRPRQRLQQQPSQTSQLSAVGATDDGSGWASPSRGPPRSPAAANTTTPRAGVAKKKSPPPSPRSTSGSVGIPNHGSPSSTSTASVLVGAAKKMSFSPSSSPPSFGSVGASDHGVTPSPSTNVDVAPTAPAFGTSFSQYNGFDTAIAAAAAAGGGGGWGSSLVPSQGKPSSIASAGGDLFGVRSGVIFDQTRALPKFLLDPFLEEALRYVAKGVREGLPAEVFKCVTLYSQDFFEVRDTGMGSLSSTESIMCKSIVLAMEALPLFASDVYYVYRAIQFETQEDALSFKDLMENGQPFVEPAFLSTTIMHIQSEDMGYFNNKNCFFAILSKTGRHILKALAINEDELEVVFRPGTSFRILSFEDTMPDAEHGTTPDQAGRYRIVMEEI